jgi:hypothetical protein
MSRFLSTLYLLLVFQPLLALSQFAVQDEAEAAYIRYNGTVSGSFSFPPALKPNCPDWTFPKQAGSDLYVGAYPSWDKNSFFFNLYHLSSGECDQTDCPFNYAPTNATRKRQFITFTEDSIFNLQFTSAAYECFKDNKPCSQQDSFIIAWPFYYVPLELLDLDKAEVKRVDVGGEKGYHVEGDEKTWVGNGTWTPHFDIAPPETATGGNECYDNNPGHFAWYV